MYLCLETTSKVEREPVCITQSYGICYYMILMEDVFIRIMPCLEKKKPKEKEKRGSFFLFLSYIDVIRLCDRGFGPLNMEFECMCI